ncbi:hypothetical protein [Rubinisphaera italica]|uniref:Uncharacterized protein n=1 Tax=Rubinisphaera italica TaxID=2527969 RepID=A0A5C5XER3_9PLAN|nr:hypothetical protein [Rubinisphaera italica]TWT60911.1 hypothetical protein Pan54_16430 [Rubinisphaera italica]
MLFLGIDQHARQLTVSLRDQQGDVLLARQVSTRPVKILQSFDQLKQRFAEHNESFIAALKEFELIEKTVDRSRSELKNAAFPHAMLQQQQFRRPY